MQQEVTVHADWGADHGPHFWHHPSASPAVILCVQSGGSTSISVHNSQQFRGWNWTESLMWSAHEQLITRASLTLYMCPLVKVRRQRCANKWIVGEHFRTLINLRESSGVLECSNWTGPCLATYNWAWQRSIREQSSLFGRKAWNVIQIAAQYKCKN